MKQFPPPIHFDWIDLAKGFLMIFVFIYHSEVIFDDHHSWSFIFGPIRMSGFFFLSGYLFTSDFSKVSFKKKGMQVIRSVIIPYIIYMTLYAAPKLLALDNTTPTQLFIDILLFRASWFIPVMGMMQLAYGYVIQKFRSFRAVLFTVLISSILSALFISLYRINPTWLQQPPFWSSNLVSGKMPFCINNACLASIFFGSGIMMKSKFDLSKLKYNLLKITLIAVLFIAIMLLDKHFLNSSLEIGLCRIENFPIPFLYATLGIFVLCCISIKINKISFINFIGRNSLNFYYLNALTLRLSTIILTKIKLVSFIRGLGYFGIILNAMIAVLIAYLLVLCIIKYFPLLTGRKDVYNAISQKLKLNINW